MTQRTPLRTCSDCPAPRQGRKKRCDDCQREHDRRRLAEWRKANPEKVKAQQKRNSQTQYARRPDEIKARAKAWTEANKERANTLMRASNAKRRALARGNAVESVDYDRVAERDEWTCGICGEPVDRSLRFPDPASKSIDHVLPIEAGGSHTYANVQLTHLRCNFRKGRKVT